MTQETVWTPTDVFALLMAVLAIVIAWRTSVTNVASVLDHLFTKTLCMPMFMLVGGVVCFIYGWTGWYNTTHHPNEYYSFEYPPTAVAAPMLFGGLAMGILGIMYTTEWWCPTCTTNKGEK